MKILTEEKYLKLYELLTTLCKKTIDRVTQYKDQGKLESTPYQKIPVKEIDYDHDFYSYNFDKIEYFDHYTWQIDEFSTFIDEEIKTLPEYDLSATELANVFNVEVNAAKKSGLLYLIRLIMNDTPNGHISHNNIDEYIKLFVQDCESQKNNKPIRWNIELWLSGIYIESDKIEVAPEVFITRPKEEQLHDITQKHHHITFQDKMNRGLPAGAILSFSMLAGRSPVIGWYHKNIIREIDTWLNAFWLFKPSNVFVIYQRVLPVSIFEHAASENKVKFQDSIAKGKVAHEDTSSYKFFLKKEEEPLLIDTFKSLRPILRKIPSSAYLSGSPYDLALHRYIDSLHKTEVNAYKILSSVSSIEALLTDGSPEITFKVMLRVAKLLSFFGFKPLEVSMKMKDAYNLRSKLVHGANPIDDRKDLLEFARQSTHEIINYNRICLLISLQLKKAADKSKLIKWLDDSLIDSNKHEELKALIEEKVRIHITNPFRKFNPIMEVANGSD